jgi:hypothetical protein
MHWRNVVDLATDAYNLINDLVRGTGTDQMPNPYRDICYLNQHGHWQDEPPEWAQLLWQHFDMTPNVVLAEIYALRYEIEWLRRRTDEKA